MSRISTTVCLAMVLLASVAATAQDAILPYREYAKRTDAAQKVSPLTDAAFGADTSLYNGSTTFRVVDIDLPGNSKLPVQLARTLQIDDRTSTFRPTTGGFADWQLDVPYMDGTFAWDIGWKVGAGQGTDARCSNTATPALPAQFQPQDAWHGYNVHIPGVMSEPLLVNNITAGFPVPQPADGQPNYPWISKSGFRVRCLTISGTSQGFRAIGPDGTKYDFTHLVSKEVAGVRMPAVNNPGNKLRRARVFLMATRVEDRHGNWVTYTYSGNNLTQINSNDSRNITLGWTGDRVFMVSAAGKNWTYFYKTGAVSPYQAGVGLERVVLPDSSEWLYSATGSLVQPETWQPPAEAPSGTCDSFQVPGQVYTYSAKHPAGSTMAYSFQGKRHYRTRVNWYCTNHPGTVLEELLIPNYSDVMSLMSRTITGGGVSSHSWTYDYGIVDTFGFCYQNPTTFVWVCPPPASACQNPSDCPPEFDAKYVTVIESGGRKTRYTFGTAFDRNEGRLLAEEVLLANQVKKRTQSNFIADNAAEIGTQFAGAFGTNLVPFQPLSALVRPVRETLIALDGTSFESYTNLFDNFARPKSLRQRSRIGGIDQFARTELVTYEDQFGSWTVGQVKSRQIDTLSAPTFLIQYNGAALPISLSRSGLLVESYTYYPDGTLRTIADGLSRTTTLSNWYRGVPQTVSFPDITNVTAIVNSYGSITQVTDQLGNATNYAYDAMGRVSQITYPSGPIDSWSPTVISFTRQTTAKYGLPIGHWRQLVSRGNYRKETYFDGLWRPVIEREYDNAAATTTQRFKGWKYDIDGRVTFAGYPRDLISTIASFTTGVSSFFDVLNRPTQISQSSELGELNTLYSYLPGFETQVTSPRHTHTYTNYQVFDQPDTSRPVLIEAPEGQVTAIARDLDGHPRLVNRSGNGPNGPVSVDRRYVYDDYRRLCKTIEPETGSTVQLLDAVGNVTWSASGQALPSTTDCNLSSVPSGQRITRYYDTMNRVTGLTVPGGNGNQNWTYTADGLPENITTYNDAGTSWVVNNYTYNKRRMLAGESQTLSDGVATWTIGYGYDTHGSLASLIYPAGLAVTYLPNALGQSTQVASSTQTYASGVSYWPNGAIKQFTYGNQIVHTLTQNARQLPQRSKDAYGATVFHDDTMLYDENGNVTAIGDGRPGSPSDRGMVYDGLDRLVEAESPMFGSLPITYQYDAVDNLARVVAPGRNHAYCYDASNRLTAIRTGTCAGALATSFSYDPQGNVANKNGLPYATFDIGNRLRQIGSETYRYDGHGRRVRASQLGLPIYTMYSQSGQPLWIRDERASKRRQMVYLGGSLIAERTRPIGTDVETITYQHTDALGSPVVVTGAARNIIPAEESKYEPYGKLINRAHDDTVGYTGHVMDQASGLVYMQQRYYDPTIGRFVSADPIPALAQEGNFNKYAYVRNNPYGNTDPDGRQEVPRFVMPQGLPRDPNDLPKTENVPELSATERVAAEGQPTKDFGMFRPDGHDYKAGRDDTIVPPGGKIGTFLEDKIPAGHTFAVYHDAVVDKAVEDMGIPDIAANVPTMPGVYAVALAAESINLSAQVVSGTLGTELKVPFEHEDK